MSQQDANQAPLAEEEMKRDQGTSPAVFDDDAYFAHATTQEAETDDFVSVTAAAPCERSVAPSGPHRVNVPVRAAGAEEEEEEAEAEVAKDPVKVQSFVNPTRLQAIVVIASPPYLLYGDICYIFCKDWMFRSPQGEPIPWQNVNNALHISQRLMFWQACLLAAPVVTPTPCMAPCPAPLMTPQPPVCHDEERAHSWECTQCAYEPREHTAEYSAMYQSEFRAYEEEAEEEQYPPQFSVPQSQAESPFASEASALQLEEAKRDLGDSYNGDQFQQWKRKCRVVVHGVVDGESWLQLKQELAKLDGIVQDKGWKRSVKRCPSDKFGVFQCVTLQSPRDAQRLAGTWIQRPGGHHWEVREYHSRRGQRTTASARNGRAKKEQRHASYTHNRGEARARRSRGRRGKKGGSHHNRSRRPRAVDAY